MPTTACVPHSPGLTSADRAALRSQHPQRPSRSTSGMHILKEEGRWRWAIGYFGKGKHQNSREGYTHGTSSAYLRPGLKRNMQLLLVEKLTEREECGTANCPHGTTLQNN